MSLLSLSIVLHRFGAGSSRAELRRSHSARRMLRLLAFVSPAPRAVILFNAQGHSGSLNETHTVTPTCYAVGGRVGNNDPEISSLDSLLRYPPVACFQQLFLREDL